jgi:hypothetical protein
VRELEIGQELLGVLAREVLDALDLHDDSILHDEIREILLRTPGLGIRSE